MAGKKKKDQQVAQGGFVPATPQKHAKKAPQQVVLGTPAPGAVGQYSRNNPNYQSHARSASRGKKAGIVVLVIALIAALAGGVAYAVKEIQKSNINQDMHSGISEAEQAKMNEVLDTPTVDTFDEPFNVLLLGSDAREDDPDMGARTDTIIVVRVDAVENTVSMVSIPRDTFIEVDGAGVQKFNAAYTYGGESGTIAAVKKLTGVEINHFAEVNFESLVGLVDAIGGIDVMVEEEIDDEDAGGHIDAGKQHLDGEHALIFARSRHYVDGDYTRQVNQRKVILAIVNKALTAPATELTGLIQASTKFVTTDSGIDFDFIKNLADQMRHNEKDITIYSATIPSSTATINDVSYVIADTAGVAEMMKIFKKGGDVSEGVTESSITQDIENAKKIAGDTSSGPSANNEILYDGSTSYIEQGGEVTPVEEYTDGMSEVDAETSPELYEENYSETDAGVEDATDGSTDESTDDFSEDDVVEE